MRSPEQRARQWLFLYPRAYRDRRGEELVATLLDKARDDPRLPAREIAVILIYGVRMRVRRLRMVFVALLVAVVGAGAGSLVGFWFEPPSYIATTTIEPASMIRVPVALSSSDTNELHRLSTRFAVFQRTPAGTAFLDRDLHRAQYHLTCSDSVVNVATNHGIQIRCVSPSAYAAKTVVSNLTLAFNLMFEGLNPGVHLSSSDATTTANRGVTTLPVGLGATAAIVLGVGIGATRRRVPLPSLQNA